ncbi:MAG: regulatory protein RecX [Clostridiales bacterium]|jgi:regulatory protein|nr:regulatory protein RecX [Clostridiales bacterium]
MRFSLERLKGGRVRLFADGEQFAIVTEGFLRTLNLKEGDELTAEEIEDILTEQSKAAALNKALRLITHRMHSRGELVEKLRREFPKEAAQYAADEAESMGLVNDAEFSSLLAEELFLRKGFARRRIIDELRSRGVSAEVADSAVNISHEDEQGRLKQLVEEISPERSADEKERRRLINNLLRKGYNLSDINRALEYFGAEADYNETD